MDNFWSDEMLYDFMNQLWSNDKYDKGAFEKELAFFKKSKEPKKEYEIISYKNPRIITDIEGADVEAPSNFAVLRDYPIHSVKRLHDGEVFTLGDNTTHGEIISFKKERNYLLIKVEKGVLDLCELKKAKEVLFTKEEELTSLDVVQYLCETGENICAHGQKERMLAWKRHKILKDAFNKSKL
jgi:hypothetical protein